VPTYEYECKDCGKRFDIFQSITADPIEVCPSCNGRLKKLFSPGGGFLFKGSGFYITDYRSKEYKEKANKECKATTDNPSKDTKTTSTSKE
jgi:putative FmdB family regulatory protein